MKTYWGRRRALESFFQHLLLAVQSLFINQNPLVVSLSMECPIHKDLGNSTTIGLSSQCHYSL